MKITFIFFISLSILLIIGCGGKDDIKLCPGQISEIKRTSFIITDERIFNIRATTSDVDAPFMQIVLVDLRVDASGINIVVEVDFRIAIGESAEVGKKYKSFIILRYNIPDFSFPEEESQKIEVEVNECSNNTILAP